ncbi:MAG: OadG-related small transporter subunit [Bacteroidota bacterium]
MQETKDSVQTVQGTNVQNSSSTTSVTVPVKEHDQAKDINSAIEVTGIAMVAIFGFMLIFFLVIKAIDKFFPNKVEK